jgi:hypothetical protein
LIFEGWIDTDSASSTLKLLVDDVLVFTQTGSTTWSGTNIPIPSGFIGTVTSGSHNYKIVADLFNVSGTATQRAFVMDFWQPSYDVAPPSASIPVFMQHYRNQGMI